MYFLSSISWYYSTVGTKKHLVVYSYFTVINMNPYDLWLSNSIPYYVTWYLVAVITLERVCKKFRNLTTLIPSVYSCALCLDCLLLPYIFNIRINLLRQSRKLTSDSLQNVLHNLIRHTALPIRHENNLLPVGYSKSRIDIFVTKSVEKYRGLLMCNQAHGKAKPITETIFIISKSKMLQYTRYGFQHNLRLLLWLSVFLS